MRNLWKFLVPAAAIGIYVSQRKPKYKKSKGLILYKSPTFVGEDILVDRDFVSSMDKIGSYANKYGIKVYVTSSFRKADQPISDNIVESSQTSNHFVGHAIDMNPEFDGTLYGSSYMKNFESLPIKVQDFLLDLSLDKDLRWGGDFKPKDTVHIDDNLYNKNKTEWHKLYNEYQKSTLIYI